MYTYIRFFLLTSYLFFYFSADVFHFLNIVQILKFFEILKPMADDF